MQRSQQGEAQLNILFYLFMLLMLGFFIVYVGTF